MRLQLPFWGKLVRSNTMIFGKEYTERISNPLARQNVAAVCRLKKTAPDVTFLFSQPTSDQRRLIQNNMVNVGNEKMAISLQ